MELPEGVEDYERKAKHKTMTISSEERVEREKHRRKDANTRMREKVAAARILGICRCGGKLDTKPRTKKYYSTCPECREKGKASANRYYREGPLEPRVSPPVKLDLRINDSTGVRRRLERDGLGREAWWWIANGTIGGSQSVRRWSVQKYGDREAWRLAMAQRRDWKHSD